MEHIHLAGEDEDDMYAGFNEYNATLDTFVSITKIYIAEFEVLIMTPFT